MSLSDKPLTSPPSSRTNLYITITVIGLFLVGGLGVYLREQHTHGPFSADDYVDKGLIEAKRTAPDAVLLDLSATYVDEQGQIRAAFSDGRFWRNAGHLVMGFRATRAGSASREKKAVPLGAPVLDASDASAPSVGCQRLRLSTGLHGAGKQTRFGTESGWRDDARCADPMPPPIHCRIAGIWKRAITDGAPHPAYADIDLQPSKEVPTGGRWRFQIVDHTKQDAVVFERFYPDDCTR